MSIVSHNNHEDLIQLLDSFDKVYKENINFEIIITINVPEKQDFQIMFPQLPIRILSNSTPKGFGANHNAAYKVKQKSRYFLVVNPDITFFDGSFNNLIAVMDQDDSIVCAVPKVFYPDMSLQRLCKQLPTPMNLFARRFIPRLANKLDYEYEMQWFDYNSRIVVPYVSGCFMAIRSDVYKKLGGFDERFFMYMEDTDLSRRLNNEGKVLFVPEAQVIHAFSKESYKKIRLLQHHIISALRYFQKWH